MLPILVLDANNNVIYFTPVEKSNLAKLVKQAGKISEKREAVACFHFIYFDNMSITR